VPSGIRFLLPCERQAAEIRIRAERKTGQLLKETKKTGERNSVGQPKKVSSDDRTIPSKKLADLGISNNQSSQWQKLADIPEEDHALLLRLQRSQRTHLRLTGRGHNVYRGRQILGDDRSLNLQGCGEDRRRCAEGSSSVIYGFRR
jgi:hypothetical protein